MLAVEEASTNKRPKLHQAWSGEENPTTDTLNVKASLFSHFALAYKAAMNECPPDVRIIHSPFKCCQVKSFIKNKSLVTELENELRGADFTSNMNVKSNDLYCFKQSIDLHNLSKDKFPALCHFVDILATKVRPALQEVTGIPLSDDIAVTVSSYEKGDFLNCHDDKLGGRRIAFIYYITPEDWNDSVDGGALDLYNTEPDSQIPSVVVDNISPIRNSFSFFEVNPFSFHRVSEVTRKGGSRFSINGWFHGPPLHSSVYNRKSQNNEKKTFLPIDISETEFLSWMSPAYLRNVTLTQISRHFNRTINRSAYADMILSDLIQATHIQLLADDLNNFADGEKFTLFVPSGPPDRRSCSILPVSREGVLNRSTYVEKFLFLLLSDAFMVLLSQMTGLSVFDISGAVSNNLADQVGCCFFEVRMWSPGDYSLLRDTDQTLKPGHVALHFFVMSDQKSSKLVKCEDDKVLSLDANPGCIVYCEKGKKEPVVTIDPQNNSLAIVVSSDKAKTKDHGLVHFNRYMNRVLFGSQRYFEFYLVFGVDPAKVVVEASEK